MAEHQPTLFKFEEWLPVHGFEGAYEVSDWGRVRSLDRIITTKAGIKQRHQGRVLTPAADRSGHLNVNLGPGKKLLVHRLVLEAFIGPSPEGQECCHNDGDPTNNNLANLRWDTRSENVLDSVRHRTHNETAKTHCPRGHELASPNLKPSQMKRGRRNCLACARAHSYVRNHPGMTHDFQQVSDSYHRSIMAQGRGVLFTS